MKKITKVCVYLIFIIILMYSTATASAYERILVLYPASSQILIQMGMASKVVGKTRSNKSFPGVISVGSHIRPNIELINSLNPDLIIAGSKRTFPLAMKERTKADVFYYDPRTLDDILVKIKKLGDLLNKEKAAQDIIRNQKEKLHSLSMPLKTPTVIYEIMEKPLRVAGKSSIVTSIIKTAGGINLIEVNKKHVSVSIEKILKLQPAIYIYQHGPMNKNPMHPEKRSYFIALKSLFIKVDELKTARPGLNAFDAVIELNRIFREHYTKSGI